MQCEEVRPLLDAYLDGEVAEAERTLVRNHIEDCAECGPEAAALERLRDGIRRAAPVYRAPQALRSSVRSAVRREATAAAAGSDARVRLARLCRLDPARRLQSAPAARFC